jgi:hypothetical protein
MIGKGLNAMPALLKFLVLLALFLSVHHANAFISLTSVAQNQVQVTSEVASCPISPLKCAHSY